MIIKNETLADHKLNYQRSMDMAKKRMAQGNLRGAAYWAQVAAASLSLSRGDTSC